MNALITILPYYNFMIPKLINDYLNSNVKIPDNELINGSIITYSREHKRIRYLELWAL